MEKVHKQVVGIGAVLFFLGLTILIGFHHSQKVLSAHDTHVVQRKFVIRIIPTPSPTIIPTPTDTPMPTPTPTEIPTPIPTTDPTNDAVWDRLAWCESHQNWGDDTGNGYYGGLQFSQSAWESVGGSGSPAHASREEQIMRGKMLQARRGWGPWGGCSRALGFY
jgi:hypothetical protein